MKTKKLIELLQEADPSGEEEVCVDNIDIYFVEPKPAYWDGRLQVLKRDESMKGYNIVGAKWISSGKKINLVTVSIKEAMIDNPDLPVEVIDIFVNKRMQKEVDQWRAEARQIIKEAEEMEIEYEIQKS